VSTSSGTIPPNAGWNSPLPSPLQRDERDQNAEAEVTGRVHHGEPGHDQGTRQVRPDQERAAGVTVGEDAAHEQGRHHGCRVHEQHHAERARLVRERERPPPERDHECCVADLRDGLPEEEQPEVALAQRVQQAQARRSRGDCLHDR
jgi:hypothetical protein